MVCQPPGQTAKKLKNHLFAYCIMDTFAHLHTPPPFSGMSVPAGCNKCEVVSTCKGGAIDRRILYYNSLEKRDPYCPLKNKDPFPGPIDIKYYNKNNSHVPHVHDGYLPTLIFAP